MLGRENSIYRPVFFAREGLVCVEVIQVSMTSFYDVIDVRGLCGAALCVEANWVIGEIKRLRWLDFGSLDIVVD